MQISDIFFTIQMGHQKITEKPILSFLYDENPNMSAKINL